MKMPRKYLQLPVAAMEDGESAFIHPGGITVALDRTVWVDKNAMVVFLSDIAGYSIPITRHGTDFTITVTKRRNTFHPTKTEYKDVRVGDGVPSDYLSITEIIEK